MARNPEKQRPRSYYRRRFRISISLDSAELRLLQREAEEQNLALGATIRAYAVTGVLAERRKRGEDILSSTR